MAIVPSSEYPGQTNAPSADYPQGSARDVTVPGAGDGTPWRARVVNDIFGLLQGLLEEAGITPSGDPDTATDSQYVESINTMITSAINALNLAQQIEDGAETVFDDKVAAPDAALASLIDQRSESVFDAEVAAPDAALVALIDSRLPQFTEISYVNSSTGVGWVEEVNVRATLVRRMVVARVRLSANDVTGTTFTWSNAIPDAGMQVQDAVGGTSAVGAPDGAGTSEIIARVLDTGSIEFERRSGSDGGAYVFNLVWPVAGFPNPTAP